MAFEDDLVALVQNEAIQGSMAGNPEAVAEMLAGLAGMTGKLIAIFGTDEEARAAMVRNTCEGLPLVVAEVVQEMEKHGVNHGWMM